MFLRPLWYCSFIEAHIKMCEFPKKTILLNLIYKHCSTSFIYLIHELEENISGGNSGLSSSEIRDTPE